MLNKQTKQTFGVWVWIKRFNLNYGVFFLPIIDVSWVLEKWIFLRMEMNDFVCFKLTTQAHERNHPSTRENEFGDFSQLKWDYSRWTKRHGGLIWGRFVGARTPKNRDGRSVIYGAINYSTNSDDDRDHLQINLKKFQLENYAKRNFGAEMYWWGKIN